ncbi:esterase-like activity of phytase family protein [Rhizobium sp. SSA_523]|uniref:esterase-like activity of phytase family protein n=1 Tax=Rhizobium sp. SSA_523 TaxID=2952477 RepID=UPI002090CF42|nr:esterase-like activity of phytase family protein [Rhizobium sp. SSA_523]MCO5733656.1 esterase-like activity of phytase family protein [Rhizobium sp. SSA_523]WKC23049.1 esterase-like activity of phytase family protein [Rhizobium sp. SSA_523]
MVPTRLLLTGLLALALVSPAQTGLAEEQSVPVTATRVERFKPGSSETRFGSFEFLGGLEFSSSEDLLGSISSLRLRADGASFVAVLDTGHWLTGRLDRSADGRLSGLYEVRLAPMLDGRGEEPRSKSDMDAEGVALRDGEVLVSYERTHRIAIYPDPGFLSARPGRSLDILIPRRELRANGGLETMLVAPADGPLQGAAMTIAEKSVDDEGNLFAAILEGPMKGGFKVRREAPWDVTDGAFLPDGDLLLLERRFSFLGGLGMRIRRISGLDLRPGSLVDGTVILEADMGFQIDNMEGMDVIEGADGHPHVILVSDDNHSILQRNLLLEFRLLP